MIKIEKIKDEKTFEELIDMKVSKRQNKFVASNVLSFAEAWLDYENAKPFAIRNDDNLVGFIMLYINEALRKVGIWRLMIARKYQKHGYGRKAMEEIIKMIKETNKFDLVFLDYVKSNKVAKNLYHSLGFVETGEVIDGEVVMTMRLTNNPKVCINIIRNDDINKILKFLETRKKELGLNDRINITKDNLINLINNKKIKQITIYGDPIGIILNNEIYLDSDYSNYVNEIIKLNGCNN